MVRQIDQPAGGSDSRVAGLWSAVLTAVGAVAFVIGAAANAFLLPANVWTGDAAAYAASFSPWPMVITVVPSLVTDLAFVVLVAVIHVRLPPERKHWSLVAFGAAIAFATILVTNYYLQLSFVRLSIEAGRADSVALLVMENPRSAFGSVEALAYGVQGLAAAAIAIALSSRGLERRIRWSFGLVAASGILSLLAGVRGVSYTDPVFITGGALWAIALPVAAALCAVLFRRGGQSPAKDHAEPRRGDRPIAIGLGM